MPTSGPEKLEEFPLQDSHDFKLCCPKCVSPRGTNWSSVKQNHECEKNLFLVRRKKTSGAWTKVRCPWSFCLQRRIRICPNFPRIPCINRKCRFAHNKEELEIWHAEKTGRFNTKAFIAQLQGFYITTYI